MRRCLARRVDGETPLKYGVLLDMFTILFCCGFSTKTAVALRCGVMEPSRNLRQPKRWPDLIEMSFLVFQLACWPLLHAVSKLTRCLDLLPDLPGQALTLPRRMSDCRMQALGNVPPGSPGYVDVDDGATRTCMTFAVTTNDRVQALSAASLAECGQPLQHGSVIALEA